MCLLLRESQFLGERAGSEAIGVLLGPAACVGQDR